LQFDRPVGPLIEALAQQNILAGYDLSADYPELGHALLVCATEARTEVQIDAFATALDSVMNSSEVA
jgi:glycine dehydrogenase subunit 1